MYWCLMDDKSEKCSQSTASGEVVDIIIKLEVKHLDFFYFVIYKRRCRLHVVCDMSKISIKCQIQADMNVLNMLHFSLS